MEPIRVPQPPAEAFNKNRRVSDLIRAQVNHFKHVEQKLTAEQRKSIPQLGVVTEADAAKYIAAMTSALRGLPAKAKGAATPRIRLVPAAPVAQPTEQGLAIAASGGEEPTTKKTSAKKAGGSLPKGKR
jgi:hypothetical protein